MNSLREQVETLRDAVEWLEALDPHTSCNLNVAPDWVPGIPECTCGADQRLDRLYEAIDLIDAHRCLDPERLARALRAESKRQHDPEHGRWTFDEGEDPIYDELLMRDARSLAAAYEEQG